MSARFDVSAAFRAADRFGAAPKKVEEARVRAITRLSRALIPEATRDIRSEYALTATRVRKGLSVHRTNSYVELVGAGEGIGIGQGYQGRQTKSGVVAKIRVDSAPVLFRHAFLAKPGGRAKATGTQAFEREGKRAPRYPLDRLFSQTIAGMLRDPSRANRIANFGRQILAAEIERLLKVI